MRKGLIVRRILLVAIAAITLASCERGGGEEGCAPGGGNLIQDPDFALEAANKRSRLWGQSQHAGEVSFATAIDDGVLTIRKTGTQPWFAYRQILRSADLGADLVGQKLVFSAQLKLDLQPPKIAHGFGDGGWLTVTARSASGELLLRSERDHEPHIGTTDWQTVEVFVELPSDTDRVELTFLHQADGVMSVRKPYFGPLVRCGEP